MSEPFLLKYINEPDQGDLEAYVSRGGYEGMRRGLSMAPEAVIDEVDKSGLRGRGGAGFPTGRKWKFIPRDPAVTKYLVVNADEGEPGTYKDRTLMEGDPHRLIEGIIIGSFAIGARQAFIYLRREFAPARAALTKAIAQARSGNYLGRNILHTGYDLEIILATGAGAYIAGEETALLESLEGRRAMPRLKPPFYPAVKGLYMQPTAVNNVETLHHVAWILAKGHEWYKAQGAPILISVSGHVERPGVYEVPLGTTIRTIIDLAGGMRRGRKFKACFPGGSSSAILTDAYLDDVVREIPAAAEARTLVGLAGTVTTVAAVELGLETYDRDRIHHFHLTREAAEDVFRTLAIESRADRVHNPGLEEARADVIVGGCCVLVALFRRLGFDEMIVSEADILDGLALSLLDPR